ncbi:hypothetical protein SCP_1800060 [Sparassis crispa]|uniref:F-box domain-containing protein n=1 Tax=Sparassis crispa TaxID=139825 RepID=A0A401H6D6_9APHY|nr:hypothetical protein SCP_1800060 [Sparassis crispa]GBE89984.1 hypothetical protein SCP_1800060 [Sparassis crispa]
MDLTPARAALLAAESFVAKLHADPQHTGTDSLDRIEETLRGAILSVRHQFNALRPVNRLPPEILRFVFQELLEPVTPEGDLYIWASPALRSTRGLKGVSHVCRRWRQISLGRASATPDDAHGPWATHAPLAVSIFTQALNPFMLELCRSDGARLAELCIASPLDPRIYTDFPAPALQRLTLQSDPISDRPYLVELFRGDAPRLRALALQSSFWLPKNPFPALTRLLLAAHPPRPHLPRASWTLPALRTLLANCPALEEALLVRLRHDLPPADDDDPAVPLPRLRRLAIGDCTAALAAWLLRHLAPPPSAALRLFALDAPAAVLPALPRPAALRTLKLTPRTLAAADADAAAFRIDAPPHAPQVLLPALAARVPLCGIVELHVEGRVHALVDFPRLFGTLGALAVVVCRVDAGGEGEDAGDGADAGDRAEAGALHCSDVDAGTGTEAAPWNNGTDTEGASASTHAPGCTDADADADAAGGLLPHILRCLLPGPTTTAAGPPPCPHLTTLHVRLATPRPHPHVARVAAFARARPLVKCVVELAGAGALGLDAVEGVEICVGELRGAPWPAVCGETTHRFWPAW